MVKITTEDIAGSKVRLLRVSGIMDSIDSNEFFKKIQEETAKGNYYFIADMTGISYINSSGILYLLCSKEQLKKDKGTIKYFGFNQNLCAILEDMGMLKMIQVYETMEECLRSFSDFFTK